VTECLPSENEAPSSNFSTVKKPNEPQAFWLYFPASEEALSPWAGVLDTLLGDPQVKRGFSHGGKRLPGALAPTPQSFASSSLPAPQPLTHLGPGGQARSQCSWCAGRRGRSRAR
jgi:hypothetical protein